jgi:pimeloyl-ACP methyl ester carboxylesterase
LDWRRFHISRAHASGFFMSNASLVQAGVCFCTKRKSPMNTTKIDVRELSFESQGARLFAIEQGDGSPIVFLHGGLADHRASTLRLAPLAHSHRLITPDVRGAGRSKFSAELSWDLLADDVAALLGHLGLQRAVIGGISAGSAIALRFALRHPARVAALVLASPVYGGAERGLDEAPRRAMERMEESGRRTLSEGISALYPLLEALPPNVRDIALTMARGFDPASVAATTLFLASGAQPFDHLTELASIQAPVLIVPGSDPEHPAEVAELYAQWLPYARRAAPEVDLACALAAFLDDAGPGDSPHSRD